MALSSAGWAAEAPAFLLKWGTYGTGPGQFAGLTGIATGAQGELYVTDGGLNRIQVFSADSLLLRTIGSSGAGPGQFTTLEDCAVDASGNIYALDSRGGTAGPGRIEVLDPNGQFLRQWDLPTNRWAHHIVLSLDDSTIFASVGEFVLKMSLDGVLLKQWSYQNTHNGDFGNRGIAIGPSGVVYVASINLGMVIRYSPDGDLLGTIGSPGGFDGQLENPLGVAVDASERLYVSDGSARCSMFDASGAFLASWGSPGVDDGQFTYPVDMVVDSDGNIFVIDQTRSRIQKFGFGTTPTLRQSWGRLKARFR